jgi:hypothetical protein
VPHFCAYGNGGPAGLGFSAAYPKEQGKAKARPARTFLREAFPFWETPRNGTSFFFVFHFLSHSGGTAIRGTSSGKSKGNYDGGELCGSWNTCTWSCVVQLPQLRKEQQSRNGTLVYKEGAREEEGIVCRGERTKRRSMIGRPHPAKLLRPLG